MRPFCIFLSAGCGLLAGIQAHAAIGAATVVVMRGTAKTSDGKAIAERDKVNPGTTVITSARSFVRLLFPDQTQLNVGPDTTMKIETEKAGDASIVDLVGGQIRAKVTKDPMANHDGGPIKEKMVVKTKTAAMGIRGTDFNVSFNEKNNITALITFEGNVAMAKLDGKSGGALAALHQDKGVQSVGAGQFSGVTPDQAQASVPVKISPAQLETLKGNSEFKGMGAKQEKQAVMASPVPPGVDPKGFSSGAEQSLKAAVSGAVGEGKLANAMADSHRGEAPAAKTQAPPEGFLNKKTGEYAPRAGGFIDLASGRYVPPPAGSSFDANTGVFVPPRAMGSVDPATGMYVPPKGVDLDPVKGFVAEAKPASAGTTSVAGAAVDSARTPSSLAPPPSAAVASLVTAMNTQSTPEASTKQVTMDSSFSGGGSAVSGGAFAAPSLPPPPSAPPPPPPRNADPITDRPVSNNCATDNSCGGVGPIAAPNTGTGVNFHINVN
jgi:hypothetical protein